MNGPETAPVTAISDRAITRLVLTTGEQIEGVFLCYRPAALRFETAAGVRDVPFASIPEDLQECFPHNVTVAVRRELQKLTERIEREGEKASDEMARLIAGMKDITESVNDLMKENAALKAELTAARAQLREMES